jgi:hypothetical protein
MADRAVNTNLQEMSKRVSDIAERTESGMSKLDGTIRSTLDQLHLDETTIPDTFRNFPKLVSPRVHRWLDVAVTGYFLGLGAWFSVRGKIGPAAAAFVNAGMVAGVSLLTDYEGTGKKPINFKLHGTLDALQATTAALGPVLHGFATEPESTFFYGQAANELAVIASTDWDQGMPIGLPRRTA